MGAATIEGNLLVKGLTLSSSDSRIKEDVQPIDQHVCVEIIKSAEPKGYKKNIENKQHTERNRLRCARHTSNIIFRYATFSERS